MIPASATEAIRWTTVLASICLAIISIETLLERESYADEGLLGWPVAQSGRREFVASWFAPVAEFLFGYRSFIVLTGARLLCALALLPASVEAGWRAPLIVFVAVTSLLLSGRTGFGMDGADQMNALTFVALAVDAALPTPLVRWASLWFLALQLTMSYLVAGGAKVISEEWRSGRAMWGILSTRLYGVPPLGLWLKAHPRIAQLAAWSVFGCETGFVLLLFLPDPFAWVLIAGGVGFHLASAIVMGLNTFFWSFLAAYPALLWCRFETGGIFRLQAVW